jgi:hypothetical protein
MYFPFLCCVHFAIIVSLYLDVTQAMPFIPDESISDVDWREYYMSLADGFDENPQTASDAGI